MGRLIDLTYEEISIDKIRDQYKTLMLLHKQGQATELLVNHIKSKEYIYTTRDDLKSEVWIYKDGIYVSQGRSFIKEHVREILLEVYIPNKANEIIAKIEADTFIDSKTFFNNNLIDEICLENGILNIFNNQLSSYTPKKIFFNKIPVTYNPSADCPNIKKHLETVLKSKEDAEVIRELIGYCLLKDSKFEKSFMFLGTGRNGKSKTLEIIKNFIGPESVSSVTLKELENPFSKCELFNKMVNIAGDISNQSIKDSSWFKGLTGRDFIGADRKFLSKIYFTNYSKMLFSANDLPKTYDLSPAFWNRWLILEFPYVFKSQKEIEIMPVSERLNAKLMDEDISKKINTPEELSGLLNWSLEGLKRLLENKDFSYTKSVADVKDLWIRKSDSFMAFCLDQLEFNDNERFIEKKELRKIYSEYCKIHKIKTQGDRAIKNTFELHFGISDNRVFFCNEWSHVWHGVRFKWEEVENCKVCQLCHGFSNHLGKKNFPGDFKTSGNPVRKAEYQTSFLENELPVEIESLTSTSTGNVENRINFEDLQGILLEKTSNEMLKIDAIKLGFLEKYLEKWLADGLIYEIRNGFIRLL